MILNSTDTRPYMMYKNKNLYSLHNLLDNLNIFILFKYSPYLDINHQRRNIQKDKYKDIDCLEISYIQLYIVDSLFRQCSCSNLEDNLIYSIHAENKLNTIAYIISAECAFKARGIAYVIVKIAIIPTIQTSCRIYATFTSWDF